MVFISSEISSLKSVIVHCPGDEHHFVSPNNIVEWIPENGKLVHNPDYLLFDDLIQPERAANEHNQLTNVLSYYTGSENTIQFTDLLHEILDDHEIRKNLINECCFLESESYGYNLNAKQIIKLNKMNIDNLINVLLSGSDIENDDACYFKYPVPNLMFTRDIAAVIGNTVLLTWGRRRVRKRENIFYTDDNISFSSIVPNTFQVITLYRVFLLKAFFTVVIAETSMNNNFFCI